MKTLWIHIGMPKTASTAIQEFCRENAQALAAHGFCYPIFPISYTGVARVRNGHFLMGLSKALGAVRDLEQEERDFQKGMQIVNETFQRYDNVILSDEGIWRSMDIEKKNLWVRMAEEAQKGGFGIHVIVYFRRQDKFFSSIWNQLVKKRWLVETLGQYAARVDKRILDYYAKLERMASVVGKENITVRRFESGKFEGGSIYADFLAILGLPFTEEYRVSEEDRNTGLYGNTHEIKRILNSLPQLKDKRVQEFLLERLGEISEISKKEYPNEMLSKEEAEAFLEKYGPGNRKVAEEYLHEPGAELFDNTVRDLPKWEKDNPYMVDDIIRFIGTTGIYLYEENQELKKEIKELKKFAENVRHPFRTMWRRFRRLFQRK